MTLGTQEPFRGADGMSDWIESETPFPSMDTVQLFQLSFASSSSQSSLLSGGIILPLHQQKRETSTWDPVGKSLEAGTEYDLVFLMSSQSWSLCSHPGCEGGLELVAGLLAIP